MFSSSTDAAKPAETKATTTIRKKTIEKSCVICVFHRHDDIYLLSIQLRLIDAKQTFIASNRLLKQKRFMNRIISSASRLMAMTKERFERCETNDEELRRERRPNYILHRD